MTHAAAKGKPEGFILLVVLGAVLALSAMLFGFARTTRTRLAAAESFHRTEQARQGAWGAIQIAAALVRDVNDFWADPQTARLLSRETTFPVGDANCCLTLTAEDGLLNVNSLKGADDQIDRRRIDQLLRLIDILNRQQRELPPISYGIVPALLDWIDSDDDVTYLAFVQQDNTGAENDYYQTCTPAYACRNGPLESLEELLQVKGMTPETFARLRPYLTCVGDGKIDLNAAPKIILQSLSEQMDVTLAEMIVRQRAITPFKSLADLRSIPGMTENVARDIQNLATVRPTESFYRVRARGEAQDYRATLEALLQKNPQTATVNIVQYREL
jgi:general secretion pathway protein K